MHPKISPTALALCRAALIQTPDTNTPDIPAIQSAWATLMAASGHVMHPANLGPAHHLIAPHASQQPTAPAPASVAETTAQARPKTLACIRARGITPMSDLDGAA